MKQIASTILLSLILAFFSCSDNEDNNLPPDSITPTQTEIILETDTAPISGSLKLPGNGDQFPLVLIIAGSGPTDRNGNNTLGLSANTYKMISDTLANHGIASVRYDKRGVAKSYYTGFNEADFIFDDLVADANAWVDLLKNDDRFSKILILGHSEGALIGSIVANQTVVDGFISVSGTDQRADSLILEQLSSQPENIRTESYDIINSLMSGDLVTNVSADLASIFRPSVQPYLISWFSYDPKEEISKITSPILILHGTTDLQVKSGEAQILADHNSNAELSIIEGMNHVLKDASNNPNENFATYSNPNLPLSMGFSESMVDFIERVIN